ncbi:hypothetical protein C5167_050885 [Papaver somniferum]|uniref:Uncharacterized protein n=1 Tax=Papaver somniferum TaxID=3469 RepID=A0A4Y7KRF4_PAPSO|nr:hypothetical protein C5167_050885 [Papaver somniferum]
MVFLSGFAEAASSDVTKPELLPKDFRTIIDVVGFLSAGQGVNLHEFIFSWLVVICRNTGTAIPAGIRVGADEVVVAVKGDDSLHKSCCPVKIDPGLLDVKHFTYVEQDKPMTSDCPSLFVDEGSSSRLLFFRLRFSANHDRREA